MSLVPRRNGGLGVVIRLAREAERAAAERVRAAQERFAAADERLQAVQTYLLEYTQRAATASAQTARRVLDERRFVGQLQATVAAQQHVVDQERRQVDAARGFWLTARRKREALEELVSERTRQAERHAERTEQQQLDDRPSRNGQGPTY